MDANGQNLIEEWLNAFPPKLRTKIKSKCVAIFARANAEGRLTPPRYEKLQNPYTDLIRIGFERDKVAYRIFACYGKGRGAVWLLAGGKEQNDRYRPPGILDTALNRRASILGGVSTVRSTCLLETR